MIGRVRDLLIGDCGRRVDNLVPKNIEETLPNFDWFQKKKIPNLNWIIMSLLFVLNTNVGVVTKLQNK
jgi:hypothetical protein